MRSARKSDQIVMHGSDKIMLVRRQSATRARALILTARQLIEFFNGGFQFFDVSGGGLAVGEAIGMGNSEVDDTHKTLALLTISFGHGWLLNGNKSRLIIQGN
jgi:hypothetical protein